MEHAGFVLGALLTTDERHVLSWSDDGVLQMWDVATGKANTRMKHADRVNGALLINGGRLLSWSDDQTLRIWDITDGRQIGPPMRHDGPVMDALLINRAHRILSWSYDGTMRLWDVATGQQIGPAMKDPVIGAVPFNEGQRLLSWSFYGSLRLWNTSWRGDNLFQIACEHWPDHDLRSLSQRYEITIDEPICADAKAIPLPSWSSSDHL
jgi:WD40 repeat protein